MKLPSFLKRRRRSTQPVEQQEGFDSFLQTGVYRKMQRLEQEKEIVRKRQEEESKVKVERARRSIERARRSKTVELKKQEVKELVKRIESELIREEEHSKRVYRGAKPVPNERERIRALRSYRILDTETDVNFDRYTEMAKDMFGVPIALISLLDVHRQWFKSVLGLECKQTCRNVAFCAYTIHGSVPLIVYDTLEDSRFKNNPLVVGGPQIRFYLGLPLITEEGLCLGTFCLIDTKPRKDFDLSRLSFLQHLADMVLREFEMHKAVITARRSEELQRQIISYHNNICFNMTAQEIIDVTACCMYSSLDVDCAEIIMKDERGWQVLSSHGWKFDQKGQYRPFEDLPITNGEFMYIEDTTVTKGFKDYLYLQEHNLNSLILCPVVAGHERYILALYKEIDHLWLTDERDFVNSISKSFTSVMDKHYYEQQIEAERIRSEGILCSIFPEKIVERLKGGEPVIADQVDSASILFADIVGFTKMSETMLPGELVKLLNTYFTHFDQLTQKHNLDKIKTIGDCYMVGAGILSHEDDHSLAIINLAADMIKFVKSQKSSKIKIRIGIASGPVVAGVIGKSKPLYDVWSDTVNVASRMESHGHPGKIHIAQSTYNHLQQLKHSYAIQSRGQIQVKGKGKMATYFVNVS